MSYILDALRRADAERGRGAVPGLHAQNIPGDNEPAARDFRPLIWAAAVVGMLVIAGVLVLIFAPWRDAAVPVSREPLAPAPELNPALRADAPATPAQGELAAPRQGALDSAALPVQPPMTRRDGARTGDASQQPMQPQIPPQQQQQQLAPYPPPADAGPTMQNRLDGRGAMAPPNGMAGQSPPQFAPPQRGNQAQGFPPPRGAAPGNVANPTAAAPVEHYGPPLATSPARTAAVTGINDLPQDVRAQLPRLSVGGSIYSDTPSARMVILNGQVYHEGDKPAADTVLEQIRLKSAVLSFRGQRYEIVF